MAAANEREKIRQALNRYKQLRAKAPRIAGVIAVSLFKESFSKQGVIGTGGIASPWAARGFSPKNREGRALLKKTGRLSRSIKFRAAGMRVNISSDTPYSVLQNDGGIIKITPKMRRFFWAKYFASGGVKRTDKKGNPITGGKVEDRFKGGDKFWLRMALKKGNTIKVKARPFIYDTPELPRRLDAAFIKEIQKIFTQ